ncbi:hypothetical protein, partial [Dokdonella sp.]|uniref:hypothetical protein n=1 Tax=Dokdonella sp. TaxID=2291710 RepID=UPI002F3FAE33
AAQRLDTLLADAAADGGARDLRVVDDARAASLPGTRGQLVLPHAATGWHEKIDLRATFITPPVAACIDALAATAPGGEAT